MRHRFALALATALAVALPHAAAAATITVNSADDVVSPADGKCTLREAMIAANTNQPSGGVPGECVAGSPPGQGFADTIAFDIPGAGVHTIALVSPLPGYAAPMHIDGYTQPGARRNTLAAGTDAVLLIEIDGTNAGPGAYALRPVSGSSVGGLVINRFRTDGSGNGGGAFLIQESTVSLRGNYIGTDATGTVGIGNEGPGVNISANVAVNNTLVGDVAAGDRNVISANGHGGVLMGNNAFGTAVWNNYIGTNAHGTAALPNFPVGVRVNGGSTNFIGGSVAGRGNLISGNAVGVELTNGAANTVVQGNRIGTGPSGTWGIPNTGAGVLISGGPSAAPGMNQVGGLGAGAGNVIAFNGGAGVAVQASGSFTPVGNAIRGNAIFDNAGPGIDLGGDGVTPNDGGDGDVGPNLRQNFPVLTSAVASASGTRVAGELSAGASATYRVEVFASPACDPSGHGEGRTFLGALQVLTGGNGVGPIDAEVPGLATGEQFVTATATDASGNTSELSPCVAVSAPPATQVLAAVLPGSRSVRVGTPATAFATIINAGGAAGLACGIALETVAPALFAYQATDPATNALTGAPNTPVEIAPGSSQSFVVVLTPHAPIAGIDAALAFQCLNSPPAPVTAGLNTLRLSASTTPGPDIIALGSTPSGDGVVRVPGVGGAAAFAVATANVGTSAAITVSADTGGAGLPLALAVCQTNPVTGACVSALAGDITVSIDAGATLTFAVFLTGLGDVPFDPANRRAFLRFVDEHGQTRGQTSVAVTTE